MMMMMMMMMIDLERTYTGVHVLDYIFNKEMILLDSTGYVHKFKKHFNYRLLILTLSLFCFSKR